MKIQAKSIRPRFNSFEDGRIRPADQETEEYNTYGFILVWYWPNHQVGD